MSKTNNIKNNKNTSEEEKIHLFYNHMNDLDSNWEYFKQNEIIEIKQLLVSTSNK